MLIAGRQAAASADVGEEVVAMPITGSAAPFVANGGEELWAVLCADGQSAAARVLRAGAWAASPGGPLWLRRLLGRL
jgi:hypothetical protein